MDLFDSLDPQPTKNEFLLKKLREDEVAAGSLQDLIDKATDLSVTEDQFKEVLRKLHVLDEFLD